MRIRKKTGLFLTIGLLVLVLGFFGWFISSIFEGKKPEITIHPLPQFLSGNEKFTLTISDMERGLKALKIAVNQGGREIEILEKKFPFKGLLNSDGLHVFDTSFSIDLSKIKLAQGRVDLLVRVWDYSRRRGGDGNLSLLRHKMVVDTIPPAIRAISRLNYFNVGGTGLVVYQTSSDAIESGILVDNFFSPGFPDSENPREGIRVCYFAIPYKTKARAGIQLWAKDKAGNISKARFSSHIRKKSFRTEKMNISDRFLENILPYFPSYSSDPSSSDIEKFLKINRNLRKENNTTFFNLRTKTSPSQIWNGTWVRLKNAANMAKFADRRLYYYKGKKVDEQTHMGVDLASLANSGIQATNNGRVIFADSLGIYGLTVVLDHGQGLASVYSHLSKIDVELDQEIMRGEIIGLTGQTGLAGGDHLHFGVMVNGVFVNPIEWWDSHWIRDNITKKLALLNK